MWFYYRVMHPKGADGMVIWSESILFAQPWLSENWKTQYYYGT